MVVPSPRSRAEPLSLSRRRLQAIRRRCSTGWAGAQAVAALAFGTETIRPVSTIVGPGNAYVAAAKRQVSTRSVCDMVAEPSEVVVIADKDNDPAWIATIFLPRQSTTPWRSPF